MRIITSILVALAIIIASSFGFYLMYEALLHCCTKYPMYPKIISLCLPFLILMGNCPNVDEASEKTADIIKEVVWLTAFLGWLFWVMIKIWLYLSVNY